MAWGKILLLLAALALLAVCVSAESDDEHTTYYYVYGYPAWGTWGHYAPYPYSYWRPTWSYGYYSHPSYYDYPHYYSYPRYYRYPRYSYGYAPGHYRSYTWYGRCGWWGC